MGDMHSGGTVVAHTPSACPYGQRFWVEAPHPPIARQRVRSVLEPRPGGRMLEVGPGTGYYTLAVAELVVGDLFGDPHWVSPGALRARAEAAGLTFEHRIGSPLGYFDRFGRS